MKWNSDYRTFDDYSYLNHNFNIILLLWESIMLKKYEIKKYYDIPELSNLFHLSQYSIMGAPYLINNDINSYSPRSLIQFVN